MAVLLAQAHVCGPEVKWLPAGTGTYIVGHNTRHDGCDANGDIAEMSCAKAEVSCTEGSCVCASRLSCAQPFHPADIHVPIKSHSEAGKHLRPAAAD